MSNYLRQLIQRSARSAAAIQPRLGSRFERNSTQQNELTDTGLGRPQPLPEATTESPAHFLPMTRQPADRLIDTVNTPPQRAAAANSLTGTTTRQAPAARPSQGLRGPSQELRGPLHGLRRPEKPRDAAGSIGENDTTGQLAAVDLPTNAENATGSSGSRPGMPTRSRPASSAETVATAKPDMRPASQASVSAERNVENPPHVFVNPQRQQPARALTPAVEESIPPVRFHVARSDPDNGTIERQAFADSLRSSHVETVSANTHRRDVKQRAGGEGEIDRPSDMPAVRVTIGRIEIHADKGTRPQHQAINTSVTPRRPPLSLDDYLRQREEDGDE